MKGKPYAGKSVACQFEWNQLGDPECRLFQSQCRAMISKIWPSRGILVASSHAFHGGAAGFSPVNKLQCGSVWVRLVQFGAVWFKRRLDFARLVMGICRGGVGFSYRVFKLMR